MTLPGPRPATRAVNHVLRSAPLAMERLASHAGRTAAFHVGPVTLAFTVLTTGEVAAAVPGTPHDLEVRISPFALPRLAAREPAAFDAIAITGDAALGEDVAFLLRNLTWDVEEDLSKVVGDIAAHRVVSAGRSLRAWGRDAALRTAQGAAEYWTEESPLIATRVKLEAFSREVDELAAALERLEQRIGRLS